MIINPTNRDDIRQRAIETTSDIVLKCGNLSVRMDDVAQELSVSKRTLYEIFGSKEELLVECMKRHIARMSKIIADEMAIGMVNQKTTAVRLIPVIGKGVGDEVEFGGLLGYAPIMPVNPYGCEEFINRKGRIPAPIHSFKN